jgi:hypothetical protein
MFSPSLRWVAALVFIAPTLLAALEESPDRASLESLAMSTGSVGSPPRALTEGEATNWLKGRELFERSWTEQQGLGAPGFNAQSCAACHKDPVVGGASGNDLNVVGFHGMPGYTQSSLVMTCGGRRPDSVDQQARMRSMRDRAKEKGPAFIPFTETQAPSILGLGLIETISDELILSREDPDDLDHDGIRGVARQVKVGAREEVGRFGWKARTPNLTDFVCMALGGEVGITAPDQGRGFGLAKDGDSTDDPELSQEHFDALAFYVRHLAAPQVDDSLSYQAQIGERLFEEAACSKCHVPVLEGTDGPVELYSDLLLHEVLPALEFETKQQKAISRFQHSRHGGREPEPPGFRTPPLWGVSETAPYMHDGRSATLLDAIRAHEGEAKASREHFESLEEVDQQALVAFLESL